MSDAVRAVVGDLRVGEPASAGSQRLAKRQIDAASSHERVIAVGERRDTVKGPRLVHVLYAEPPNTAERAGAALPSAVPEAEGTDDAPIPPNRRSTYIGAAVPSSAVPASPPIQDTLKDWTV